MSVGLGGAFNPLINMNTCAIQKILNVLSDSVVYKSHRASRDPCKSMNRQNKITLLPKTILCTYPQPFEHGFMLSKHLDSTKL